MTNWAYLAHTGFLSHRKRGNRYLRRATLSIESGEHAGKSIFELRTKGVGSEHLAFRFTNINQRGFADRQKVFGIVGHFGEDAAADFAQYAGQVGIALLQFVWASATTSEALADRSATGRSEALVFRVTSRVLILPSSVFRSSLSRLARQCCALATKGA